MNITGRTWFENNTARVGPDLSVGPTVQCFLNGSNINATSDTVLWMKIINCTYGGALVTGYCQKCLPSTYNLDPFGQGSCQVCPVQANCTGGDAVVPL